MLVYVHCNNNNNNAIWLLNTLIWGLFLDKLLQIDFQTNYLRIFRLRRLPTDFTEIGLLCRRNVQIAYKS